MVKSRLLLLLVFLPLGVLAGCGESDRNANGSDRAFAEEMIPHHQAAVEMARSTLDRNRTDRPVLRKFATRIVTDQEKEIQQLERALSGPLKDVEAESLGMSMEKMGMSMKPPSLRETNNFDEAFIAMMIPHHRGAIEMARVELKRGVNPEMRLLAKEIIRAQKSEIRQMKKWKAKWKDGKDGKNERKGKQPRKEKG